jgi:energy-coupling factor transporter ATP-binding protein EcfA2
MIKLKGENFQPWESFDLTLDKLTVIVGPSNQGKSSLFRAVKGILRNEIPQSFIREGTKQLELTAETEGHLVKATRKGKTLTYMVDEGTPNEKPYSSLNGDIPDELKSMNFGDIRIGKTIVDPIFATQNEAQFLIDPKTYKDSDINAVLGAFASTEKLDKGKKEANLRISQKNSEAKTLAGEVREAEERKDKLAKLVPTGVSVIEHLNELEKVIQILEKQAAWAAIATQHCSKLIPLQKIEAALVLPDVGVATNLLQRVEQATVAFNTAERFSKLQKISDGIREVVSGVDEEKADDAQVGVINAVNAIEVWKTLRALERADTAIATATDEWELTVKCYKKAKELNILIELMSQNRDTLTTIKEGFDTIISEATKKVAEATQAALSIRELGVATPVRAQVKEATTQLEIVEQELTEAEEVVSALSKQVLCPICGRNKEHICQN